MTHNAPVPKIMSDFSFYHIADLHLDTPFKNISKFPSSLRSSLISAPMHAFKKMVRQAIEEKISFVVISGDIFDRPAVSLKVEHEFYSSIEELNDSKISVFLIYGNHDSEFFQSKRDSLEKLQYIHFFPAENTMGSFELEDISAVVYGMNFSASDVVSPIGQILNRNVFNLAIYHGDIFASTKENSDTYGSLRKNDLIGSNFDYWALGHLHQFNIVNEYPHLIYPGPAQGRSIKPSECGDKGCVKVTVKNNRVEDVKFLVLSEIAYLQLEVNLKTRYQTAFELFTEIKNKIINKIDETSPLKSNNIILRIELKISFLTDSESFSHSDQTQIDDLLSKEIFKSKIENRFFVSDINWNFEPQIDSEIQNEIFKLSTEILETDLERIISEAMTPMIKPKLKMKDLELLDPQSLKEDVLNQIKRLTVG